MTDTVQLALIALGSAVIAAVPPTIMAWKAKAIAQLAADKTDEGNQKVQQLEIRVDGRLTDLLKAKDEREKATAISAHAEGVLQEKQRQEGI